MIEVKIIRRPSLDTGTFGVLTVGDNLWSCFTLELPWRDNVPQKSCIPEGTYPCHYWSSVKYPQAYRLSNVPNREAILIHQGNWAGNTDLGYKSNVLGCILVGRNIAEINGQMGVSHSKVTLLEFLDTMGKEPFNLTIE